jgi:nicotinamide-nucleotide amidase
MVHEAWAMNAIILSIGDELVLGQTVDTNSAWLSQQFAGIGVSVLSHTTVGDDQAAIERAIRAAAQQCDLLIISGGIGPTPDDLTRQALAAVLQQPLELNEHWLSFLQNFFKKRNREMPEMNKIQAMIPRGAKIILNSCGTAAGIAAELTYPDYVLGRLLTKRASDEYMERMFGEVEVQRLKSAEKRVQRIFARKPRHQTRIFVIPGVPSEMKAMFTRDILPALQKESAGGVILSKTLHTFGLGESAIAEMLGPLMDRRRNPTVGTTVANGIVSVRINSKFDSKDEAEKQLAETENACRAALGDLIFGADEQTLGQVVGELLKAQKKTVTTAESCTGGLLAKFLTDVPGSSAYFKQGWITYSNEAKLNLLGVAVGPEGAVSEKTAAMMAMCAAQRAGADYGLGISGIAGPDGGTSEKPVGTVCIGLALCDVKTPLGQEDGTEVGARKFLFPGDREMIRDRSAKMALTMLRFHLLGKPLPF